MERILTTNDWGGAPTHRTRTTCISVEESISAAKTLHSSHSKTNSWEANESDPIHHGQSQFSSERIIDAHGAQKRKKANKSIQENTRRENVLSLSALEREGARTPFSFSNPSSPSTYRTGSKQRTTSFNCSQIIQSSTIQSCHTSKGVI